MTPSCRSPQLRRTSVLLSLLLLLVIPTASVAQSTAKPVVADNPLARMNESVDALTKKVWPSVSRSS